MPHIKIPNSNPNPNKYERPPVLKKSRTSNSSDVIPSPHFPGPLFPAVRRSAPSPPPPHPASTAAADATGFSDRDWIFPSFLGAHTGRGRGRANVNTSKSLKNDFSHSHSRSPNRSRSMPSGLGGGHDEMVKSMLPVGALRPNTEVPESENEVKPVVFRSSSSTGLNARRARGFKHSVYLYALTLICIFSVSYAIYLRNEVAKLQGEIINLHILYNGKQVDVHNLSYKDMKLEDDGSSSYFGNADSRTVALYTVLFTLAMPFLFYKSLDYFPQVRNLSSRTKCNNEEVPLKKRIAYMVDVCFSLYPYAKLLALLFATIFLIGFGGLALYAVSDGSLAEALWLSWTFVADSGNHADRVGMGQRIVSVSISSGGMLIFAMMLGLVSDAISEKVDSLRKGKSEVIERNHILILGWSDKLGSLLKQLAIANKSIGGGVVVVLAERGKEEMEMDIAKLEFDFMGTSVICRSGSPLILADLKKVSVSKARAIIVLASDENADQSDARALRVVLSLTGVKEGLKGHVVVEMSDLDNDPLVKLVGGELIETVVAHDVIGRLMIQCALQPGLAQIWEDILGFENAEFYVKRWPQLDGMSFENVLISFPDAIPCGIKLASDGGKIILNPEDGYVLKEGDEVLVIAEDDDTYAPGPLPEVRRGLFHDVFTPPKYPERILFCGWRRDIDDMITVLEALLAPGSELWMFNEVPIKEREKKLTDGGLDIYGLVNIKLVHHEGNAVIRRHLENLPLETFDSTSLSRTPLCIPIHDLLPHSSLYEIFRNLMWIKLDSFRDLPKCCTISQSKRLPNRNAKSTVLRHSGFSHSSWIREMQQASDKSIIISEILDSRTRNLVSVSRISDYVLSNELVSMALAMVAEDKQINRVLEELFAEEGNEMCIRPAEFYLFDQEELCFYEIMIRGRLRQEIVIGYRLATTERAIINPPYKSQPRKWSIDDVFVVISLGE